MQQVKILVDNYYHFVFIFIRKMSLREIFIKISNLYPIHLAFLFYFWEAPIQRCHRFSSKSYSVSNFKQSCHAIGWTVSLIVSETLNKRRHPWRIFLLELSTRIRFVLFTSINKYVVKLASFFCLFYNLYAITAINDAHWALITLI